jgi:hypothetical protein
MLVVCIYSKETSSNIHQQTLLKQLSEDLHALVQARDAASQGTTTFVGNMCCLTRGLL